LKATASVGTLSRPREWERHAILAQSPPLWTTRMPMSWTTNGRSRIPLGSHVIASMIAGTVILSGLRATLALLMGSAMGALRLLSPR
jgi:hypothetical protein